MFAERHILKSDNGLTQLVRCPQCRYMVYEADIVWKRKPTGLGDYGVARRCRFDEAVRRAEGRAS